MCFAQFSKPLDRLRRKTTAIVMHENPFLHICPMRTGTGQVRINLGNQCRDLHVIRGIALEHRVAADQPAIAFQITGCAIRADCLKISTKGITRQKHKPS